MIWCVTERETRWCTRFNESVTHRFCQPKVSLFTESWWLQQQRERSQFRPKMQRKASLTMWLMTRMNPVDIESKKLICELCGRALTTTVSPLTNALSTYKISMRCWERLLSVTWKTRKNHTTSWWSPLCTQRTSQSFICPFSYLSITVLICNLKYGLRNKLISKNHTREQFP